MYENRRVFQVNHLSLWNFTFWALLSLGELGRLYASSISGSGIFDWQGTIKWPFSYFLACWLLSGAFIRLYVLKRHAPSGARAAFMGVVAVGFGFLAKILGETAAILLERLSLGEELFTWLMM